MDEHQHIFAFILIPNEPASGTMFYVNGKELQKELHFSKTEQNTLFE